MSYTVNSISNYATAGSSSVNCNVVKASIADAMVKGDAVSVQAVSVGGDTTLAGTLASTGTAVTGTGTAFLTALPVGAVIYDASGEFRQVASVSTDTAAVLTKAFTVDLSGSTVDVKVGAEVKEIERLVTSQGLIHFTKSLRKDVDPTDTQIVKL